MLEEQNTKLRRVMEEGQESVQSESRQVEVSGNLDLSLTNASQLGHSHGDSVHNICVDPTSEAY